MNSVIAHILNKYLNKFINKEIYFAVDKPGRAVIMLMNKLRSSGGKVHLIAEKDLISFIDTWEVLCSGAEFICKNGIGSTQGMDAIAKICKKCKKSYYIFAGSKVFLMDQVKLFASQCIIPFTNVTYLLTERRLYTSQDIIAYFSGSHKLLQNN